MRIFLTSAFQLHKHYVLPISIFTFIFRRFWTRIYNLLRLFAVNSLGIVILCVSSANSTMVFYSCFLIFPNMLHNNVLWDSFRKAWLSWIQFIDLNHNVTLRLIAKRTFSNDPLCVFPLRCLPGTVYRRTLTWVLPVYILALVLFLLGV